MTEFTSTFLVQRLQKPLTLNHPILGKDNPFAFGGGLHNGGLSDEAMDILRDVWQFDYMGSSEFEWGVVPEALSKIARAPLAAFSISIPLLLVEKNWRDKSDETPKGDATIYVVSPAQEKDNVQERIRELARGEIRLKEHSRFPNALRPVTEYDSEVCGWLELDNGFLFFTDEEMWQKTCHIFGVESS